MRIKEKLQHIIKNSLIELEVSKKLNEIIIEPSIEENIDYYTNIAITLAKDMHKKPEEIAELLKQNINDELIENMEIVYPGTLNIYLNRKYIINGIKEIIEKNINYGKSNIGGSRKINIDFINDEFCEDLNINNIFNAIYGDNLSRILKYNGFEVTKEYYINDTSKKIEVLAEISKKRYENICKSNINVDEIAKEKTNIRDTASDIYKLYGDIKFGEKIEYFRKEEISTIIDNKKIKLDEYRINFDIYANEQSLYDKGIIDETLDKLNKKGYTYFNDGKLWIKTTGYGDIKDRVLIEEEGTYTYILPLIAYHIDRLKRKYDGLINIYNIDNIEKKRILESILKMLEQDTSKIETKTLNKIHLFNNKQELQDIEKIPKDINSIRYIFSMQDIKNSININIDNIDKENNIDYIEETLRKLNKILKNSNKKITKANDFGTINSNIAYSMIKKLFEFEDIVIVAALRQKPNIICNYLIELIKIFNDYYKEEQIITNDEIYTNERLNLLLAIKIIINNALDLIGIIPRED